MSREDWAFTPDDFLRYLRKAEGLPPAATRLPPRGIVVFGRADFEAVRRALHARTARWNADVAVGHAGRRPAAVLRSGVGAPAAGIALEESIALGLRSLVTFGACGSLSPGLSLGSIVLPKRAYADEGTSRHYGGSARASPTESLVRRLRAACQRRGLVAAEGGVWTIDAPYRESLARARSLATRGVVAVEMEASAIYTIARARKVQAASLLVVSDELGGEAWNPGLKDPLFLRAKRDAVRAVVDTLAVGRP